MQCELHEQNNRQPRNNIIATPPLFEIIKIHKLCSEKQNECIQIFIHSTLYLFYDRNLKHNNAVELFYIQFHN
jgi:hypothetical protein